MKYKKQIVIAYYKSQGLPEPETECKFHPIRRWKFDFAWPDHKVALEVEGAVFTGGRHTRGAGFKEDMEKYNTAERNGWHILRCTPEEVCMLETVNMIKECITYASY